MRIVDRVRVSGRYRSAFPSWGCGALSSQAPPGRLRLASWQQEGAAKRDRRARRRSKGTARLQLRRRVCTFGAYRLGRGVVVALVGTWTRLRKSTIKSAVRAHRVATNGGRRARRSDVPVAGGVVRSGGGSCVLARRHLRIGGALRRSDGAGVVRRRIEYSGIGGSRHDNDRNAKSDGKD